MKPASMKIPALATVYLDNERVGLMGDPMPRVSKVVAAVGRRPESVQVLRSQSPTDARGQPVGLDDVIDRTEEPTRPIYLVTKPAAKVARAGMHAPPAVAIESPIADDAGPRPLGSRLPDEPEAEWDP